MRFVASFFIATFIALVLFEVMFRLVNHERGQAIKPVMPLVVDIRQVRTPAQQIRQQQHEEKPEPAMPPLAAAMPAMASAPIASAITIDMSVNEPRWENRDIGFEQKYWGQPVGDGSSALGGAGEGGTGKSGGGNAADDYIGQMNTGKKETVPVSTTRPNIPKLAYENRINGWVLLAFTVTSAGDVKNIRVMDAYPRGVFEANAIATLRGWKYELFKGPDVQLAQRIDFEWQMYPYNMDRQ